MSARLQGWGLAFWCSATWLVLIVLAALTATWLPIDPNRFDLTNGLRPPSLSRPFGTTRLGEDVFAISVHGTRLALLVGVGGALLPLCIGAPLGMAAGYFRGPIDRVFTIALDAWMAVPTLVLALCLRLFLGQSLLLTVVIIGVLLVPAFARFARATTLSVVDREYVLAALAAGAKHRRVVWREVGPNIAIPLCTFLLLLSGAAILIEGALAFIGLGAPLGTASWGRLIFSGRDQLQDAWWWSLCPSAVFFVTVLSLNLLGDSLQARWLGLPRRVRRPQPAARRASVEPAPAPAAAGCAALEVDDLRTRLVTAFGTLNAVDGVTLRVDRGEMLVIVGESGAGKTMLARSLLGLEPPSAEIEGRVLLDGVDLRTLGREQLRARRGRDIAIVLQDPMTALNPVRRVGSQIAELMRLHLGVSRSAARHLAVQALADVGIEDPAKRVRQFPHELSGGQRQRVAIALALSGGPKVLIADEPTSALDVIVQAQVLDLIDRLRRERHLAVVLVTHDLSLAVARADRVAVMYAGRIVEEASAAQVGAGLRMPYASALFDAAPRISTPAHTRIPAIPGRAPVAFGVRTGCAFAERCGRTDERCAASAPTLTRLDGDRDVACWHPLAVGVGVGVGVEVEGRVEGEVEVGLPAR